jgi:hypothetical protein
VAEQAAEIDRLRARITELDTEAARLKAEYAVRYGSFRAAALDEPDQPARYTHNLPPSAPPHDE